LFAFKSPLSKGALLADEVGLGKTIEAGLVLSQKWAERKRRMLIIVPSNLRKQWHQELTEKFFLPCRILETKSYNAALRQGVFRPFEGDEIVICSYQFARNKAADVANTAWDLVVMDEAHRLRNVYKPSNIIANTLKLALANKHKLLLTATPLQNSLLELFGLVSFIDEHAFGHLKSFREQFANLTQEQVFQTLKARLKPLCHRTLRRQVTSYVPFTKRLPMVEEFTPEESEDRLYNLVSDYLRRENLQALPASQRSLMTLVLRKLPGAVAHKMGRHWIMVELGEHCHTHIIPRLKRVIDGEDPGGITEAVDWKGGGGFRYYRLAPSLLKQDKWGNWIISKEFNAPMLAEAVCKLEGFTYAPSDTVYWQHGHSTERDFLYVTTVSLSHDQLQQLSNEVGPERSLLVVCSAFRGRKEGYPNLTVKKIPKAVLSRCEWGHDDYSLKVENLPKASPPPPTVDRKGQQSLFAEEVGR
jgi:SNF2 domain-containing protein